MADFFNPMFASCLAALQHERNAAGRPELTGEQMRALEPGAREVWEQTMEGLQDSVTALGINFDRPGGVRNDATARLIVVGGKMLERMRAELEKQKW